MYNLTFSTTNHLYPSNSHHKHNSTIYQLQYSTTYHSVYTKKRGILQQTKYHTCQNKNRTEIKNKNHMLDTNIHNSMLTRNFYTGFYLSINLIKHRIK